MLAAVASRPADYYSTVAQVIPVVFGLLVLEQRVLQRSAVARPSYRVGALAVVMTLGLAELLALLVLAGQLKSEDVDLVVDFGVIGGGLTAVSLVVIEPLAAAMVDAPSWARRTTGAALFVLMAAWGASSVGLWSWRYTLAACVLAPLFAYGAALMREALTGRV